MDTSHHYLFLNTNAKIILITACEQDPGTIRSDFNVYLHAVEVRYIHTQIVDQSYELLITLIYIYGEIKGPFYVLFLNEKIVNDLSDRTIGLIIGAIGCIVGCIIALVLWCKKRIVSEGCNVE